MKAKVFVLAMIWFVALGVLLIGKKYWWEPRQQQAAVVAEETAKKEQEQAKQQILVNTSSVARYKHQVTIAEDSFSGYSLLRSEEFRNQCASRGIKINLVDDGADYQKRFKLLQTGEVQMAAFPIDSLLINSAKAGELPATVVSLIDETKGADGMWAYSKVFPNLDAVNDPETKFVVTADSPSENLVRVVMTSFNMDRLGPDPWIRVKSAQEVVEIYKKAKPTDKYVYVLWEPYVSDLASNTECRCLIDSSKFKGYIVDSLAVSRDYLVKNEEVVRNIVESYMSVSYRERDRMSDVVFIDSQMAKQELNPEALKRVVNGIWFKNCQENYSHFGLINGGGLQHIEDMVQNITLVLMRTKAIDHDPTNGAANNLYYDKILRTLYDNNFHPGFGNEQIRKDAALVSLTDAEWKKLSPVGTLQVNNLVFARGTSRMTAASEAILADLVHKLKTWPQYYLIVRGNAVGGDTEINRKLAQNRAQATVEWLIQNGVDKNRLKADTSEPRGGSTVSFILGQVPY